FLVSKVLNTPHVRYQWLSEVEAMRLRFMDMRTRLVEVLAQKVSGHVFSFMLRQSGMLSYTGMTPQQVDDLKDVHGFYM
ncbi:aminotransferase class I/II-fold pyridoxal phosphate-dependent enzyme, partial [Pseudomonas syringae group genomosp. 7]|uniref:aminotransferase class I/II-fold pyridoxal phosphate-dependent enzyme n=1 Tax=Pseudomonas syringae group genomosp. 7 TaxID=251699 RepID=UPI0037705B2B